MTYSRRRRIDVVVAVASPSVFIVRPRGLLAIDIGGPPALAVPGLSDFKVRGDASIASLLADPELQRVLREATAFTWLYAGGELEVSARAQPSLFFSAVEKGEAARQAWRVASALASALM